MATQASRTLTIAYGSYSTGAGSARPIDGGYGLVITGDRVVVDWAFFVLGTLGSDFNSKTAAAEAAFGDVRKDLVVTLDGQARKFSRTDGSGTDSFATLTKDREQDADTSRSRRYLAHV